MRGDEPVSLSQFFDPWDEFPTCVGMNRIFLFLFWYSVRVPHMRGDEPLKNPIIINTTQSSPHAWG